MESCSSTSRERETHRGLKGNLKGNPQTVEINGKENGKF